MATLFASRDELARDAALAAPLRSYPRPSRLTEPVSLRGGAGKALVALGIETVADLVDPPPPPPRDRRDVRLVADLGVGEEATVAVGVRGVTVRPMRDRRRKRVEARVFDESGPLVAVWFNQPWIARQLGEGAQVLLHGKLRRRNEFWVTEHELFGDGGAPVHTVGLVPVHPATEGITPSRLRVLMGASNRGILDVVEPLPAHLRADERLPDRPAALAAVHFPDREEDERDARRRLAYEELLLLQLAVAGRRRTRREGRRARPLAAQGAVVDRWRSSLPFELTGDQARAMDEIDGDIARERPMQRLLMGEVGSGKTVVALHAMLRAVENGAQAALMAPTETLAEQHHRTLDSLLGGELPLELLTGSTPAARRRDLLARLASGQLQLVVGTHALIEGPVEFRDLALVVVDEQHRFGVRQRAALDRKAPAGIAPHALHMSATPIPRTLALTAYGDLDATVLRQLPRGRQPVETYVVGGVRARARAYERIREEIAKGRQCFVVCPLVEESEALQAKAATAEYERLRETEFRDQRVELIHGQMPSTRKQAAMEAFAAGDADVLVATSVIEVGIDVPNATVMLIEAAARERDGFRLAEIDLELRGAGDVLGTRQHGLPELRVARLPEDTEMLVRARDRADALLRDDLRLDRPEHALLRGAVAARFGSELEPIPA